MKPVALVGGALVAIAAFTGGALVGANQEEPPQLQALSTLAEGQYLGVCATVTPPDPDPCDAVDGVLRYGYFGAIVNSAYHPKWLQQNPGEVQRLASLMATPRCSIPSSPQPQTMLTFYGAALGAVTQAVACARHPEAIVMPARNAPPSGTGDRQAPSAPGPITVSPGP